jgi:hypothetical protein
LLYARPAWIETLLFVSLAGLTVTHHCTQSFVKKGYCIAINAARYWHKNRQEDQWNRREDQDMNPHNYAQLIFDKGTKNV